MRVHAEFGCPPHGGRSESEHARRTRQHRRRRVAPEGALINAACSKRRALALTTRSRHEAIQVCLRLGSLASGFCTAQTAQNRKVVTFLRSPTDGPGGPPAVGRSVFLGSLPLFLYVEPAFVLVLSGAHRPVFDPKNGLVGQKCTKVGKDCTKVGKDCTKVGKLCTFVESHFPRGLRGSGWGRWAGSGGQKRSKKKSVPRGPPGSGQSFGTILGYFRVASAVGDLRRETSIFGPRTGQTDRNRFRPQNGLVGQKCTKVGKYCTKVGKDCTKVGKLCTFVESHFPGWGPGRGREVRVVGPGPGLGPKIGQKKNVSRTTPGGRGSRLGWSQGTSAPRERSGRSGAIFGFLAPRPGRPTGGGRDRVLGMWVKNAQKWGKIAQKWGNFAQKWGNFAHLWGVTFRGCRLGSSVVAWGWGGSPARAARRGDVRHVRRSLNHSLSASKSPRGAAGDSGFGPDRGSACPARVAPNGGKIGGFGV